ncbi:TonB-dependent receptor plug domain-containing protein [Megasphaera vaginalis (ex Bordigoni et al. 2020)]|uniref:TonB-dependent receptor plug domain-containing protein n=1 Tax=Megasphaera vaginalis (ex Bordigoni et al. 2020) TaxID=2045301 RepID=UPI001F20FA08|nr:TonB-dependent receptor [Megasphaera vaginalis (ex Bordigoni et al. 2020)]
MKVCTLVGTMLCCTFGISFCSVAADEGDDHIVHVSTAPVLVRAYGTGGSAYGGAKLPEAAKTVVTEKEFDANQYHTVADILEQVNGVTMNEMVPGTSGYIRLHGSDRVAVLVDGQNIGNAQGSPYGRGSVDLATLPGPDMIERIEVVKSGSLRYGSGAVGGTINIITKKGKKNRTTVDVNSGSWGMHHYGLVNEGSVGKTSWYLTGALDHRSYYRFPDAIGAGKGRGDYSSDSFTGRIDQQLGKGDSLTVTVLHKTYDGHAVSFFGNDTGFAVKEEKPLQRLMNDYSVTYRFHENSDTPGFIRYFNDYMKTFWSGSFHTRTQGVQAETAWMNEHHYVTAGLEWTEDAGTNENANYYDRKRTNRAVYLEDDMVFGKLSFTPGIRFDENSTFGFHQTPKASLQYRPNDNLNIYADWSRVYTAPRLNDLYYYLKTDKKTSLGNENLLPETGYVQTVGFDYAYDRKSLFRFSLFHSHLDNAIRWDRTDTFAMVRNLNEEDKRGLEITLQKKINEDWEYELGYSFIKTKIDNNDGKGMVIDPANSSPNGYHGSLSYHRDKWRAGVTLTAGSGRDDTYYAAGSYLRWDGHVSYEAGKNTTIYMNVHNIGNAGYDLYPHYPAAGRYWLAGVKYTF